jgi:multidrug efflux pump subunit AcrB
MGKNKNNNGTNPWGSPKRLRSPEEEAREKQKARDNEEETASQQQLQGNNVTTNTVQQQLQDNNVTTNTVQQQLQGNNVTGSEPGGTTQWPPRQTKSPAPGSNAARFHQMLRPLERSARQGELLTHQAPWRWLRQTRPREVAK